MKSTEYNKLIRDKMPKYIEQRGQKAIIEKLRDTDMIFYLNLKLREELTGYEDDRSVEKIADIVEVLYAILDYKGVSLNKFEKIRAKRANTLGKYKEKLLLKEVIEENLSDASSQ
ncbi:MAG TPA: nucleoside triphosphate pyrophosphohydrolase [Clostridium sp.]|jgi:predicted house-cleaning noncanonical NTP pyrophosphatase (MazG superfamily)|nr:nucleoside triphosphate pyrophosphohydrolase [Clostridium sp.]